MDEEVKDRSTEEVAAMKHQTHRVESFQIVAPFTLRVHFEDGSSQLIDFRPVLKGELYGPLQDRALFEQGSSTMRCPPSSGPTVQISIPPPFTTGLTLDPGLPSSLRPGQCRLRKARRRQPTLPTSRSPLRIARSSINSHRSRVRTTDASSVVARLPQENGLRFALGRA